MNALLRVPAVLVTLAALAVALGGCAGGKDKSEPPAKLTEFTATLDVQKVWSDKVGGKSERLRLGLRPATDGARIFAGAYDGQVAAFDAATGDKVWSVKTGLALTAGPGFGDDLLAFGTANGELLVARRCDGAGALAPNDRQRGARRAGHRFGHRRRANRRRAPARLLDHERLRRSGPSSRISRR